MSVLDQIEMDEARDEVKTMYGDLQRHLGRVPNMIRVMANSPAVLDTYLHFNHALERTTLTPRTRALITVAVAATTGCEYTLALGTALARRQGVSSEELAAAQAGRASDAKTADLLRFVISVVRCAGRVPRAQLDHLRRNDFSDEEIVDAIAAVALNLFRNYFNLVVGTELDAPPVATSQVGGAA
jgi:AhpD family alkylhydroperoxidase